MSVSLSIEDAWQAQAALRKCDCDKCSPVASRLANLILDAEMRDDGHSAADAPSWVMRPNPDYDAAPSVDQVQAVNPALAVAERQAAALERIAAALEAKTPANDPTPQNTLFRIETFDGSEFRWMNQDHASLTIDLVGMRWSLDDLRREFPPTLFRHVAV